MLSAPRISNDDRLALIRFARKVLRTWLAERLTPAFEVASPGLLLPYATFVTLRRRSTGELRGCRGECVARRPLTESVAAMTIAAASDDARFPPVLSAEVPDIRIEISVLSPLEPIRPEDVDVGCHGLLVTRGRSSGLLLPQVPLRNGWDRETFLRGVCRKAGLPDTAWKDQDVELWAFQTECWEEDEHRWGR